MPLNVPCPHCKESMKFHAVNCPRCTHHVGSGWNQKDTKKLFFIGAIIGFVAYPVIAFIGYILDKKSMMVNSLKDIYVGDIWWFGWIVMPLSAGGLLLWIVTYVRRNNHE